MVKLSHEAVSLAQHQNDVTDALRKIRLDETMSKEDIRAAIDDILAMVIRSHLFRFFFSRLLIFLRILR